MHRDFASIQSELGIVLICGDHGLTHYSDRPASLRADYRRAAAGYKVIVDASFLKRCHRPLPAALANRKRIAMV